jgi:prepilin-type N-terminal cleavage/methylation domain-containing protein
LIRLGNQKAFTLIEVMIVVVVVGILAGLATVSFTKKIKQDRLKGAAQELKQFITTAEQTMRMKAGSYSIGIKLGENTIKFFENTECRNGFKNKVLFFKNIQLVARAFGPPECSNTDTWSILNGHKCLVMSTNQVLSPIPGGCFALGYQGSSDMQAGVLKQPNNNKLQTWLKIEGSSRWL